MKPDRVPPWACIKNFAQPSNDLKISLELKMAHKISQNAAALKCVKSSQGWHLTHWGHDEMAASSPKPFSNAKFCITIQISLKLVLKGPIENESALNQWLGAEQVKSHYLNQWCPHLLCLNELSGTHSARLLCMKFREAGWPYVTLEKI